MTQILGQNIVVLSRSFSHLTLITNKNPFNTVHEYMYWFLAFLCALFQKVGVKIVMGPQCGNNTKYFTFKLKLCLI